MLPTLIELLQNTTVLNSLHFK